MLTEGSYCKFDRCNRFAYEFARHGLQKGVSFTLCCPPGSIKEC
jgi:hypothetical protein